MEAFKLKSADNHSIPVNYYKRGGTNLIVASHGITSEKTEEGIYPNFFDKLPASYDALCFDFRGHGESDWKPTDATIAGEMLDLMAVVGWAQNQNYTSLFHVATSFGASIALLSFSAYKLKCFKKVVFWNPVISYWNTFIESKVEWGHEFFNQQTLLELSERRNTHIPDTQFDISAIMTQEMMVLHPEHYKWPDQTPLLIIHGDADTLVPVNDAINYAKNNKNVKLSVLAGVDHGFDHKLEEAMIETIDWLNGK